MPVVSNSQYNKGGRVLRTEVCVNDPRDFRIGRSLVHLGYLGTVAYHAIGRFLKAQAVAWATALDRSTFERLVTPSVEGGQHVAGLRFGVPQVMRLLAALGCAGLTFKAFSHTELRATLVERFGADTADVTAARLSYQLAKLRGKGVAAQGRRPEPLRPVRPVLAASSHRLDRVLVDLNANFDPLAELSGLSVAA